MLFCLEVWLLGFLCVLGFYLCSPDYNNIMFLCSFFIYASV